MRKSSRVLPAALLGLLCCRFSGVVAADMIEEDTSATPQFSHNLESPHASVPGCVLARLIERDGDNIIIEVDQQSEVILRSAGVRSVIGNTPIHIPRFDVRVDTVEDKVRRFRREGLPFAHLWQTESAAITVGLNIKGKPALWFIKRIS